MSDPSPTPAPCRRRQPTRRHPACEPVAGVPPAAARGALDGLDRGRAWCSCCWCWRPPSWASYADRCRRPTARSTVPGLTASVEVLRDDHDIPQLYADTDADLFRAQGYVHAQERFFEMDFRRHVTAGRLSEIFGEDTLETDKFIRTMDWRGVAEQEWALLAAGDPRRADGVRRGGQRLPRRAHARRSWPRSTPCSGSPGSTTRPRSGSRSTRWPGSRRWRGTCAATWTPRSTGCSCRSTTPPTRSPRSGRRTPSTEHPPIVSGGGVVDGVFEQNATANGTRNPRRPAYPPERRRGARARAGHGRGDARPASARGAASAATRGSSTASTAPPAMPLLANDPHLGISQPGIWMQMGLHCRELSRRVHPRHVGLHLLRRARA